LLQVNGSPNWGSPYSPFKKEEKKEFPQEVIIMKKSLTMNIITVLMHQKNTSKKIVKV
jgi:hypothetical protein